jgi:hypothetical protein
VRTPLLLAALTLVPLATARADHVPTSALTGRWEVEVTRTDSGRTFSPEAELERATGGVRLTLDGRAVRLTRVGNLLTGRLPASLGLAGAIGGGGTTSTTVRLWIRSADELGGTLRSSTERTSIRLRRVRPASEDLIQKARAYVFANAGDGPDSVFPAVDSGEEGLRAYVLEGAAAERLVAFTKAWFPTRPAVRSFRLDPARQAIVAVRTTFDEEGLFCAVLDRATGAGRVLGLELGVVDLSYTLDQAALDRLVPGMGDIEDVDHMDLIDRLVAGGTEVDLTATGFALRHWGAPAERVRYFDSEADWQAWYDASNPTGRWAYLTEDETDFATYTLGVDDLWHVVIKVTRATGAIEVVGEH